MTLVDEDGRDGPIVLRRRRRWILVAVVAVVATLGAVLFHVDRENGRYGPFEAGSSGGVLATSKNVIRQQSGQLYALPDNPHAYVQLIALLSNDGSRATRVDSIAGEDGVTRIDWSRFGGNYSAFLANTSWQAFPATVPAHGAIRLRLTIHRLPECAGRPIDPGEGAFVDDDLRVHWSSPLGSHTTTVNDGLSESYNVQTC